jgi:hypothetical protein
MGDAAGKKYQKMEERLSMADKLAHINATSGAAVGGGNFAARW